MKVSDLTKKYLDNEFVLKSEFESGNYGRSSVLERAERYAGWTLPQIFPAEDRVVDEEMQHDYQSVGAQCVTNLANKVMMTLFQPSKPFFKLELDQEVQTQVMSTMNLTPADIEEALAETERESMKKLNQIGSRVATTEAVTQLIITGNALLYTPMTSQSQVYSLRDYIVKRDLRGNVVKLILREVKTVDGLSDELAALAMQEGYSETDEVTIYTGIQRVEDDKYVVWQELEDICYCHKKVGVYTKDKLPWLPLTWNLVRGADYGTGLVENYAGDFHALSTIAEAIIDFTTVATDVKTLVDPMGQTDVNKISQAPSGSYVYGKEEDLHTYTADVANITDFLEKQFNAIERRLGIAFLLNSSVTRDAERVTKAEIRMQVMELENSLGGVYSRLARDLQLPLAKRLIAEADPVFAGIEPTIVAGLDSLSRNNELDSIRAFMADLEMFANVPDDVRARLDLHSAMQVLGAGHGVDYKKLMKTEKKFEEDKLKSQQQALQMEAQSAAIQNQGQQTQ